MRGRIAVALLSFLGTTCTSIGPGTVPHDRIDYGSSIGNSWKEQTLLNIVKLRYADMPIFLEVAQVIAGYQLQSALSGSFTLGNFTASLSTALPPPVPRPQGAPIPTGQPWSINRSPVLIS